MDHPLDRLADALDDRGHYPVILRGGMGAKAPTALDTLFPTAPITFTG